MMIILLQINLEKGYAFFHGRRRRKENKPSFVRKQAKDKERYRDVRDLEEDQVLRP